MRYSHSRINFGTGGQRLKARVSIEKRAERFNVMLEIARHGNGWHFDRLYDGRCRSGPFLVICLCTFRAILLVLRCYARKRPFFSSSSMPRMRSVRRLFCSFVYYLLLSRGDGREAGKPLNRRVKTDVGNRVWACSFLFWRFGLQTGH